jgi:transposase InsO family protein
LFFAIIRITLTLPGPDERFGMQNGYIESFIEDWRLEYNHIRPHMSLDNLTPAEYALMIRLC